MKKFAVQTILLLTIITGALVFFSPFGNTPKLTNIPLLPQPPKFQTLQINGNQLKVEIADTDDKRSKGLSDRDSLPEDQGMLFVYPKPSSHPFWMKGMRIALDFIWIKGDKVVDLIPGVPPPAPGTKDADLPIYTSKTDTDKILEVNTGVIQKLNVRIGDTVKLQ